jgi:hypothetical protein
MFPKEPGELREMSFSREEIREWKREGWTFRVKTSKGKRYISRRHGKFGEKGMGRYSEELWNLVQNTDIEPSPSEQRQAYYEEAKETFVEVLRFSRTMEMMRDCSHIKDGFCHFWKYEEKGYLFSLADEVLGEGHYKQVIKENGSRYWVFKLDVLICSNCPGYKPKNLEFTT